MRHTTLFLHYNCLDGGNHLKEKIGERIKRKNLQKLQGKSRKQKMGQLLLWRTEMQDEEAWKKKGRDTVKEIIQELESKGEIFIRQMADLNQQILILEQEMENQQKILEILAKTRKRLEELRVTETPAVKPVEGAAVKPSAPQPPRPSQKRKRINGNGTPPYQNGGNNHTIATNGSEKPQESVAQTVERLKKIIASAEASPNTTIRILASNKTKYREKHTRIWENIFRKLGFTRNLQPMTYEGLGRTTDTTTIVIVPFGMNAHAHIGRWREKHKKNSVTLLVSEKEILDSLASQPITTTEFSVHV
ncbi:hypothetical protein HZA41_01555 [Candidatus Peregrinibacteria bacterium]|nr:hypothetical protein [Candidatus Peregrinibacteria bacterium]